MLGCQYFFAQQDWTYRYFRRKFGDAGVREFSLRAMAGDAQQHYSVAASTRGLAGLLAVWGATGEDEQCDWSFTLDESRNALRWDMRRCPTKALLAEHDCHADADFCDHCIEWIAPAVASAGVEIAVHEHNHLGQCWGELRVRGVPHVAAASRADVRDDPRWSCGHVDTFTATPSGQPARQSVLAGDEILKRLSSFRSLLVLGRGPSAAELCVSELRADVGVLVTDPTYATGDVFDGEPAAVLIGDMPAHLVRVAERYRATPPERRPLLLHAYLPSAPPVAFLEHGLPRPVPILPMLIEQDLYQHEPTSAYPTSGVFLALVAAAVGLPTKVAGVDLYAHPSRRSYAVDAKPTTFVWPDRHSLACDVTHLRRVAARLGRYLEIAGPAAAMIA